MASVKLHEKFLRGLEERRITIEEFNKYKYAGGNRGSHKKYFKICGLLDKEPPSFRFCICNHPIEEQCYLANEEKKALVIGNCCIKKFVPKENRERRCTKCNEKHRNIKDNYCKKCRELCKNNGCNNLKKSKYTEQCIECIKKKEKVDSWKSYCDKNKGIIRNCIDCNKPCGLYKRCFSCKEKIELDF